MKCVAIIERWTVAGLAKDLGIPPKNVRRWLDFDSIPAEWFSAIARAAESRGYHDITVEMLAGVAEARRLERTRVRGDAVEASA
jgi:hypothetical protein